MRLKPISVAQKKVGLTLALFVALAFSLSVPGRHSVMGSSELASSAKGFRSVIDKESGKEYQMKVVNDADAISDDVMIEYTEGGTCDGNCKPKHIVLDMKSDTNISDLATAFVDKLKTKNSPAGEDEPIVVGGGDNDQDSTDRERSTARAAFQKIVDNCEDDTRCLTSRMITLLKQRRNPKIKDGEAKDLFNELIRPVLESSLQADGLKSAVSQSFTDQFTLNIAHNTSKLGLLKDLMAGLPAKFNDTRNAVKELAASIGQDYVTANNTLKQTMLDNRAQMTKLQADLVSAPPEQRASLQRQIEALRGRLSEEWQTAQQNVRNVTAVTGIINGQVKAGLDQAISNTMIDPLLAASMESSLQESEQEVQAKLASTVDIGAGGNGSGSNVIPPPCLDPKGQPIFGKQCNVPVGLMKVFTAPASPSNGMIRRADGK